MRRTIMKVKVTLSATRGRMVKVKVLSAMRRTVRHFTSVASHFTKVSSEINQKLWDLAHYLMLGQYRPGLTCDKHGSKVLLLSARVARVLWSTKIKEYIHIVQQKR